MQEYLQEWQDKITELSNSELALIQWKTTYQIKSDALLDEARKIKDETGKDIIKEAYGGNNDKTRKLYVKEQLIDWDKNIQDLELSIDYLQRRISFLKGLVGYAASIGEPIHIETKKEDKN